MTQIAIFDWIARHADSQPDRLALVDDVSGRTFTYQTLNRRVGALATYLADEIGIGPGDRIATLAHNSTNILEVQFACMRLGALFVPLNVRFAAPEIAEVLEDCGARLLLHDSEFSAVAAQVAHARGIVAVEMNEEGRPCPYEAAIGRCPPRGPRQDGTLDETWTLIYTSGTTGRPKGVLISYQMVVFHALNYGFSTGVTRDSHGLTFLPMFHTSGLNLPANPILHAGGCVTVMRRFDPARALALLSQERAPVTHSFGVPANYLFMRQLPEFATADLRGVRSLGVGGAPMPIPLLQAYADKGVSMQQTFGMTETGPTVTILAAERGFDKLGSAGLPVMHVETMIADGEGTPVTRGEIGELCVRGPSITTGYWNRPEESSMAFRAGWFRTGDMARQDADGYFYIVDRCKNMYISGGENVYPAEVERVLEGFGGIVEVAVVAEPDARWGEVGRAFVVCDPARSLAADDILRYCRSQIAGYKVPKFISFTKQLPRNATGKVDRSKLLGLLQPETL
ncbi:MULTISPECIES: acyl-CoA synthetase [unclassified Xanthobacter]|uniref:acyl-CoA synthetase n=1 Tax=unclassified Xanthobacter TaxID=2623496 RepID=UPI001EDFB4C3|nr:MULTISPECIES: long-chain fatty acid--CoA ligase [unclassified Xanthobacter]